MALHFMATLGTSLYKSVIYDTTGVSDEYIQMAGIRCYLEEIKQDGRITVFLTEEAKKRNWDDREYTEKDKESAERGGFQSVVMPGEIKRGLRSQIREILPDVEINAVDIPDGRNQEDLMDTFEVIFNSIQDGDEIVFDMTHGFRWIPTFAVIVLNYAKTLKDITIREIYYGAYEAKDKNTGVVPVFDLTAFNDVLEWSFAADSYRKYGNTDVMKELYQKTKRAGIARGNEWNKLGNVIQNMDALSISLLTGRGSYARNKKQKKKEAKYSSIKKSYQIYKESMTELEVGENMQIRPIIPIIDRVQKDFNRFDQEEDYKIGLETVRWSIENGMIQQGYTALEETIKTFLCDYYHIDNALKETRDEYIGVLLNSGNSFSFKKKKNMDALDDMRDEFRKYFIEEDPDGSKMYAKLSEEEKLKCDRILKTISAEIFNLTKKVKDRRNDINHFGFNPDPMPAEKLKDDLKICFIQLEEIIEKMNQLSH